MEETKTNELIQKLDGLLDMIEDESRKLAEDAQNHKYDIYGKLPLRQVYKMMASKLNDVCDDLLDIIEEAKKQGE